MQHCGPPHLVIGGELPLEQDEEPSVAEVEILCFLDLLHQFLNINNLIGVMLELAKAFIHTYFKHCIPFLRLRPLAELCDVN